MGSSESWRALHVARNLAFLHAGADRCRRAPTFARRGQGLPSLRRNGLALTSPRENPEPMTPAATRATRRARIRRALLAVMILVLSLVIAGCGGCGDDDKDKPPVGKTGEPTKSLVAKGDSASADGA